MFYADGGNLRMREARLELAGMLDPSWCVPSPSVGAPAVLSKCSNSPLGRYAWCRYTRNGVHFGLFMGSIVSQGTQEQQDDWVTRCMVLEIFGCMAMTVRAATCAAVSPCLVPHRR